MSKNCPTTTKEETIQKLLIAAEEMASKASSSGTSATDSREYATAAECFAKAAVALEGMNDQDDSVKRQVVSSIVSEVIHKVHESLWALGLDSFMMLSVKDRIYRRMVATLACAIYNDDDWDKQKVAALLCMGDPTNDYMFKDNPPEKLTDKDVMAALDSIFERAES